MRTNSGREQHTDNYTSPEKIHRRRPPTALPALLYTAVVSRTEVGPLESPSGR